MITRRFALTVAVLAVVVASARAQAPPSPVQPEKPAPEQGASTRQARPDRPVYRVELTVSELEGASRVNSRTYVMLARSDSPSQLRVGSRVPIATEKGPQYQNIGLNADLSVEDADGRLTGMLSLELNTVIPGENDKVSPQPPVPPAPRSGNPVLRDLRVRVPFALTLGKPSVVSTVDDVNSARKFLLELVATRM